MVVEKARQHVETSSADFLAMAEDYMLLMMILEVGV